MKTVFKPSDHDLVERIAHPLDGAVSSATSVANAASQWRAALTAALPDIEEVLADTVARGMVHRDPVGLASTLRGLADTLLRAVGLDLIERVGQPVADAQGLDAMVAAIPALWRRAVQPVVRRILSTGALLTMATQQARKYSPDQDRDERGRFAEMGGGGSAVPQATTPTASLEQQTEAARKLIASAMGVNELPIGPGGPVYVSQSPVAIRAALPVAMALREMEQRGYKMPATLWVTDREGGYPGGFTNVTTMTEGRRVQEVGSHIEIYLPRTIPADVDIDAAVRAAFEAKSVVIPTTVHSVKDIVVHEMGHYFNGVRLEGDRDWEFAAVRAQPGPTPNNIANATEAVKQVAGKVSEYARSNVNEFLAETFTRLYRGDELPSDVHDLYAKLKGKYPLGYKRAA